MTLVHQLHTRSARKGFPYEARVITSLLPTFLTDFFPPNDIMNKVIGEFLSNQQPHPQLMARVVFHVRMKNIPFSIIQFDSPQVFEQLLERRQIALVQDWVMLSLSNFTQRTPVAMAIWSLTCFFISASSNPWLRSLYPFLAILFCRLFLSMIYSLDLLTSAWSMCLDALVTWTVLTARSL